MVGAVLHGSAWAQDTTRVAAVPLPPPKDTTPKDTIKAPLAHGELPVLADPVGSRHWTRQQLAAAAALTVQDLIEHSVGGTSLHVGWFAPPMVSAFLGDAHRVRVFIDGVEMDALDPHSGGALDLSQIPLWAMEEATVERTATEIRVYLRSWRVDRTTPYTRTDISTGDQQSNLYRALFGRRFSHGELLQFAVQQYGTTPERGSSTSDQLSLFARVGAAHGKFSFDGMLVQIGRHRGVILDRFTGDSLPSLESTSRDAYLRAGYGDPDAGPWVQAVASSRRYTFGGGAAVAATTTAAATPVRDTSYSRAQYVLTGGLTEWGIRLSAAERYRVGNAHSLATTSARAAYDWCRLSLSAYAEGKGPDSVSKQEGSAVLMPLGWLRLSGALGSQKDALVRDAVVTAPYSRAGGEIRIHDLWLGGGVIKRGRASLAAPILINDSLTRRGEEAASGVFASVQGRLWRAVYAEGSALKWSDSTGLYRPQVETREELYLDTGLPDRFPRGTFHFTVGLTHSYRSAAYFPIGGDGVERVTGYRTIGAKVQVRVMTALLTYQLTNMLGESYTQVPGFIQPKQVSWYGIQWEFWN